MAAGEFALSCPLPLREYPAVTLAHGGGGRLTGDLIQRLFLPAFRNPQLEAGHDGAVVALESGERLAFTTDSYVISPLFFPGSDIGALAVNGTVNDLAMCGARPRYLSAGFIIEEGLPMETLWRVARSMAAAAAAAGVTLVTGDTKVVDRGKGDGLFISTAGIGLVPAGVDISPARVRPGDALLISGDLGRHGMAVMGCREGLTFQAPIESDCAPLAGPVAALLEAGVEVHCLRDLTRGGLASAAVEIAEAGGHRIEIEERAVPVLEAVRGACEILGLDPLYVANEGRFAAFVPQAEADRALAVLQRHPPCAGACLVGRVAARETPGLVMLESPIGVRRVLDLFSGEQLPRIC
ncbi:MAG: hydrogenase expression/formation protein HypE [Gemmatimonadota bacterium]